MAKDGNASDVTIEVLLLAATAQSMPGGLLPLHGETVVNVQKYEAEGMHGKIVKGVADGTFERHL